MLTPWSKIYCSHCVPLISSRAFPFAIDILWEEPAPPPKPMPLTLPPPPLPPAATAEPLPEKTDTSCPAKPRKLTFPVRPRKPKGLLRYKKWWFYRRVSICVNGTLLCGTPICLRDNTLRVVNNAYSYFIPLKRIDYIRTPDGLDAAEKVFFAPNPPPDV